MKILNLLIALAVGYSTPAASDSLADEPSGKSVYQFHSTWHDQNARRIELAALAGNVQLVAFVYTYCEHTCPLIVARIKSVLDALPEEPGRQLKVTLITLDPERDTPGQMKSYMQKHQLTENRWTMLAGDPGDVRVLSNLFGVKYRPMQKNELAHSNMITLLDTKGVIQFQLRGLNEGEGELVKRITALLL